MKDIVLLHGAIGASDQLEKLKSELEKDYRVFTMDFIGHGKRSNEESVFSIEIFAADLDRFLSEHHLIHPVIFGYSMGGYVAIYHALHYSNKAEKIITLGTKFSWTPEIASKETRMLNANLILEKVPQFAQQLSDRHGENNWKSVLAKTAEMMTSMGEENPMKVEGLKELSTPIRFGWGDRDQMVSIEETYLYYKNAKNGSMYVLPDTFHPIEKVRLNELIHQIKYFAI